MISVALKDMYDELEKIGIAFDGYEVRKMEYSYNGSLGCCDYGVLSDAQKKIITTQKLAEVLAIAKKWDTYLVINPERREMLKSWQSEGNGKPLGPDAISVCFIQTSVFQTWLDAGALVRSALTRNFLHYQEDTKILAIETALEKSKETFEAFQRYAYDIHSLHKYSLSLRFHYVMGYFAIPDLSEIEVYTEDAKQQEYAVSLSWANHCIELVRKL